PWVGVSLQRGHGPEAVVGQPSAEPPPSSSFGPRRARAPWVGVSLQRGHGPEAVVGGRRRACCSGPRPCFNGATARRPWSARSFTGSSTTITSLQRGHGPEAVVGS